MINSEFATELMIWEDKKVEVQEERSLQELECILKNAYIILVNDVNIGLNGEFSKWNTS